MATIINNPPSSENSNGPIGMIIGLICLLIVLYLFFMYGLPALRHTQLGTPQITVPSTINLNVTQQKQ